VSGVFGATLPYSSRIFITNAAGLNGRLFTIPTSLVSSELGLNPALFLPTAIAGYLGRPSGAPLAEVTVVLRTTGREPHQARTGNDGSFDVGIVGADPRATYISFARDGFQPIEEVVGK
jgi:hypothetical protein